MEEKKRINNINIIRDFCIDFLTKYNKLCLLVIFAVFLFSRLFHLDITPAGIHYDEAGFTFDAKLFEIRLNDVAKKKR